MTHLSPSPGSFELPAFARDVRLPALERPPKVLDSLAGVPLAPEQNGIRAGGSAQSKLVEGETFAASRNDAFARGGGEAERGDGKLRDLREALVVKDGADDNDGLGVVRVGVARLLDDTRYRDWGTVDLLPMSRHTEGRQMNPPCS